MRFSDYRRLGKISINSRKKSTKNTVRGISFGLILIVSVVFLAFAVFMSFNAEVNKIRTLANFSLESKAVYDTSGSDAAEISENGYISRQAKPSYSVIERIKASDACYESVTSSYFSFTNSVLFSLDGGAIKEYEPNDQSLSMEGYYSGLSKGIKVCYLDASGGKIVLDAEKEDLKDNPVFSAGGGFTAASGGKTEVIIAYNAAKALADGAVINSLIGKKLTLYTNGYLGYESYLDDNTNPDDPFIIPTNNGMSMPYTNAVMTDFVIKGILSEEFFTLTTREREAQFWVSDTSLYYDDGDGGKTSLLPELRVQTSEDNDYIRYNQIITYKDTQSKLMQYAAENGIIFPFLAGVNYNLNSYGYTPGEVSSLNAETKLQGANFADSVDLTAVIDTELAPLYPGVDSSEISGIYQSFIYRMFKTLFTALQVVVLILFIFGGVIFVTSMLNLYNSINYSVQARRNYLGMMRAIGAKSASIPKMYFVEMVLIFARTLIWVVVFSFAISFGLRLLIGLLVKQAGDMLMGMNLSLNMIFYPISLVAVYGIVFIIAVFFALASCGPVSKKPILDVLRTDI